LSIHGIQSKQTMWFSASTSARVWNSLPTAVQSSESLDIFRRHLKTELFERSYNWHRACHTAAWLTFTFRSYLLWPQPWSLSTIMLLWHSFLIIIIIIEIIVVTRSVLNLHHWVGRMWGKIVANVFLELNATEPDPWPIKWCTVNRFWQKVLTTQTHYRQKYGKVISITEHTV